MRGLRDPLGSRIRCMQHETIEKALEFVHEETNTLYLQRRNEQLPEMRMQPQSSTSKFNYGFMPPMPPPVTMQSPHAMAMPGPSRQMTVQPAKPIWKLDAPQYRMPSRTQQMFSAPPQNYRPQSNIFKLPLRNVSTGHQPMSGTPLHYVSKLFPPRQPHDWRRFGNPPPTNYFKTREINFNESYDKPSYDNPQNEYDYCQEYHEYLEYNCEYSYKHPLQYSDNYCVKETQDNVLTPENKDFQKFPKSDKSK